MLLPLTYNAQVTKVTWPGISAGRKPLLIMPECPKQNVFFREYLFMVLKLAVYNSTIVFASSRQIEFNIGRSTMKFDRIWPKMNVTKWPKHTCIMFHIEWCDRPKRTYRCLSYVSISILSKDIGKNAYLSRDVIVWPQMTFQRFTDAELHQSHQ